MSNGLQQVLNLVFGIFLARLLSTEDYGMIGMLTIFSSIAVSLQEGGFVSALNRKTDVSYKDYNAVFWTSLLTSIFLYTILFFCAPLISKFYGIPELTPLARYVFIAFVIGSLGVVPNAYMFRNMMIRERAIASIFSLVVSGFVGIIMAALGFAYWGIATQTIIFLVVITSLSYYFTKWHPTLHIDFSPIKELFGFSSKLIVTNIFNIINGNIFSVILGKMYTPHDVGNYTQANKWNNMGSSLVNGMLGGIAQPVFAKTNDDMERQKKIFRKLLRFTAFISFPAMFGLALVSKEFIVILLTDKWFESAQMMQLLCIAGAFAPISSLFSNLIISRGHSTTYMWCTISLCVLQLISAIIAAPYGINYMIILYICINIGWIAVWHHYARNEINLKKREVFRDIIFYLVISVVLVLIAEFALSPIDNIYLRMMAKILFVASLYCLILFLSHSIIFKEVINYIRGRSISI